MPITHIVSLQVGLSLPARVARFARLGLLLFVMSVATASTSAGEIANIHYGADEAQVLDLYLPPDGHGPNPFLVFFHGGAFVGGDKNSCAPRLVARLIETEIAVACVNYRLAPRVIYPAPMMDGARAIQWLKSHALEYNLKPTSVAVMGMSAGAGIAQWIAFHNDLGDLGAADPVLRQSTRVLAVVVVNAQATYDTSVISAEFHTTHFPNFLAQLFGAASVTDLVGSGFRLLQEGASPIAQIHAGVPPLLAYYTSDLGTSLAPDSLPSVYLHHPAQGALIEKVARARGVAVTVHSARFYPGGLAGFIDETVRFLQSTLPR